MKQSVAHQNHVIDWCGHTSLLFDSTRFSRCWFRHTSLFLTVLLLNGTQQHRKDFSNSLLAFDNINLQLVTLTAPHLCCSCWRQAKSNDLYVGVRLSVTQVICGDTRQVNEFIFGTHLPLGKSNLGS